MDVSSSRQVCSRMIRFLVLLTLISLLSCFSPPRIIYGGWTPILPGHPFYFGTARKKFYEHQAHNPYDQQQYAYQGHHYSEHTSQPQPVDYHPASQGQQHSTAVEYHPQPQNLYNEVHLKDSHSLQPPTSDGYAKDIYSYYPQQSVFEGLSHHHQPPGHKPMYLEKPRRPSKHLKDSKNIMPYLLPSIRDLVAKDLKVLNPGKGDTYLKLATLGKVNPKEVKAIGHIDIPIRYGFNDGETTSNEHTRPSYPPHPPMPHLVKGYQNYYVLGSHYPVGEATNTYKGSPFPGLVIDAPSQFKTPNRKHIGYVSSGKPNSPVYAIEEPNSLVTNIYPTTFYNANSGNGNLQHKIVSAALKHPSQAQYNLAPYPYPVRNYYTPHLHSSTNVLALKSAKHSHLPKVLNPAIYKTNTQVQNLFRSPNIIHSAVPGEAEQEVAVIHVPVHHVPDHNVPVHHVPSHNVHNIPTHNEPVHPHNAQYTEGGKTYPEQDEVIYVTASAQYPVHAERNVSTQQYAVPSGNGYEQYVLNGTVNDLLYGPVKYDINNVGEHESRANQHDESIFVGTRGLDSKYVEQIHQYGDRVPITNNDVEPENTRNRQFFHAYYAPSNHVAPEGYVKMSLEEFNKLFKNAEIKFVEKEHQLFIRPESTSKFS